MAAFLDGAHHRAAANPATPAPLTGSTFHHRTPRPRGDTCGIGYFLSCEEYTPAELVEQAVAAEEAGFDALWISDHYHPWNDEQGQSPFVWGVIGALSHACSLPVTTAVTCPTVRMHPAVVAQAAATAAVQLRAASSSAWAWAKPSTSTSSATSGPRPTPGWRCSRKERRRGHA